MPRTLRVSEELTRKEMIDPQVEKMGWHFRASVTGKAKDKAIDTLWDLQLLHGSSCPCSY